MPLLYDPESLGHAAAPAGGVVLGVSRFDVPLEYPDVSCCVPDAIAHYLLLTHDSFGAVPPERMRLLLSGSKGEIARAAADVRRRLEAAGVAFRRGIAEEIAQRSESPTRENLSDAVEGAARSTRGSLFVGLFTHCVVSDGVTYVITRNARPGVLAETAVPMRWVRRTLRRADAHPKLLLLDLCHAGLPAHPTPAALLFRMMAAPGSAFVYATEELADAMGRLAVFCACLSTEHSRESDDLGHSLLCDALIRHRLERRGHAVTLGEAYACAFDQVTGWMARHAPSQRQTPTLNWYGRRHRRSIPFVSPVPEADRRPDVSRRAAIKALLMYAPAFYALGATGHSSKPIAASPPLPRDRFVPRIRLEGHELAGETRIVTAARHTIATLDVETSVAALPVAPRLLVHERGEPARIVPLVRSGSSSWTGSVPLDVPPHRTTGRFEMMLEDGGDHDATNAPYSGPGVARRLGITVVPAVPTIDRVGPARGAFVELAGRVTNVGEGFTVEVERQGSPVPDWVSIGSARVVEGKWTIVVALRGHNDIPDRVAFRAALKSSSGVVIGRIVSDAVQVDCPPPLVTITHVNGEDVFASGIGPHVRPNSTVIVSGLTENLLPEEDLWVRIMGKNAIPTGMWPAGGAEVERVPIDEGRVSWRTRIEVGTGDLFIILAGACSNPPTNTQAFERGGHPLDTVECPSVRA